MNKARLRFMEKTIDGFRKELFETTKGLTNIIPEEINNLDMIRCDLTEANRKIVYMIEKWKGE